MRAAGSAVAGPTAAGATAGRIVAAALVSAAAELEGRRTRRLRRRGRLLVPQAALQAAAQPRQLRRVETEVLLLRHLDRDRLEGLQEGRAAQRAAAGAIAADHLGFVADADLAHLDAGAKLAGQLAHQLAEIDAAVRREVEHEL